MGSKSQRRKEQYAQRRNEKLKRKARKQLEEQKRLTRAQPLRGLDPRLDIPLPSNARHRQRLAEQIPRAWPGEMVEDAAVFDDAALGSLPSELVPQVTAVREALQEAVGFRGEDALKRVSDIPRGSSLSEWRLFVRGLIDWLAGESGAAAEAWKRLDPERRPGRIATTMMIALRPDLAQALPRNENSESAEQGDAGQGDARMVATARWEQFDAAQLYHGKLLRRVRFDRAALRAAEAGLSVPEEAEDLLLGPKKIHWLARFIAEYGDTEPDLTARLGQVALHRAFNQDYVDLFDDAAKKFSGPRHDRSNRLLASFYYSRFTQNSPLQDKAAQVLNEYLRDLPKNELLLAPVRTAIASCLHLDEAISLMRPPGITSIFDLFGEASENSSAIRRHLSDAVKAAPNHVAAYKAHVDWINSKLADDRLARDARAELEDELVEVMRRWSQGTPNETEPRLWLVDYLLESEQLEEARPHVDFLAACRQDLPRVRATPWKWQLLEAMRLCRRKGWIAKVPDHLAEADKLWPVWLSKQWLPYLKAAWTLRTAGQEAFAEEHQRICQEAGRIRGSLADACMMLGAAQSMRATATELKPLRADAEQAIRQIGSLPIMDLFETGSFFWDLHRVRLLYPAYRLQGKSIGKELFRRLEQEARPVLEGSEDERIQQAIFWGSEFRFWLYGYETKFPAFFSDPALQQHPAFLAARANSTLKERYPWGLMKKQELGPQLRSVAASARNAYYRHWFLELADQLEDKVAKELQRKSNPWIGNLFGFGAIGMDDDEDGGIDNDLGFDPDCDCFECQAAKRAYEQGAATQ